MRRVSLNRDMEPVACMVSSASFEVGTWLWIYGEQTGVLLHCRVTDISAPSDEARHRRTRRIAELSFEVTARVCGATREPSRSCPITVVKLP